MTRENCAAACCAEGFHGDDVLIGVEYGMQCFCGRGYSVTPSNSTECTMPCKGNSSQKCGGSDAINVFTASCPEATPTNSCQNPFPVPLPPAPGPQTPAFHGCTAANASTTWAYCDVTKSDEERVDAMLSELNLTDLITLLAPTVKPYCGVHSAAIPKMGLPRYKWLTEVNSCVGFEHCVAVPAGSSSTGCTTVFVGPEGMAASFNRTSWRSKGDVMSSELRALNNLGDATDIGLTGYGPNINIVKDPRYGRNSELPGESDFLSGSYAVAMTNGMQAVGQGTGALAGKTYQKMLAYVKHYTAYSVETNRFVFSNPVSQFDFFDTFLPQYEMVFKEGNSSGAMCSYFAPNGVSLCGNPFLLNGMLRSESVDAATGSVTKLGAGLGFNRSDVVVMSDCAAVGNMMKNVMKLDQEGASAQAMNAGLNVYGGWDDNLWGDGFLASAIAHGKTSEVAVRRAVRRTMLQKMKVGLFDQPWEDLPWAHFGAETIGSAENVKAAYDAALQSFVLLKNGGSAVAAGAYTPQEEEEEEKSSSDSLPLPLAKGSKIAVVGPLALATTTLISDYAVNCPMLENQTKLPSIASAIALANVGGTTTALAGIDVNSGSTAGVAAALKLVAEADTTVLVLGITRAEERETIDREHTLLPGQQLPFAQQVLAAAHAKGSKVVLVSISGGIVSLDTLAPKADAIVDAFNPAFQGPPALASLLFGDENRWGKLPVTIYPSNYTSMPGALALQDMSFATLPGRSHRYYNGTATFVFGAGLSFTTFEVSGCKANPVTEAGTTVVCTVKNTGTREGDEVVQIYHVTPTKLRDAIALSADPHAVPIKRLIGFERVSLAAGANTTVSIDLALRRFALTNTAGDYVLYEGAHTVSIETGVAGIVPTELSVAVPTAQTWTNLHG